MTHADVLTSIAPTHALRAEAIGSGCKDYQVRDWIRRDAIPIEWIILVAKACAGVSAVKLLEMAAEGEGQE